MKGKENMDSDFGSKVSYNKRKKTLVQKMKEITTLCGVEASLVMYSDMEEGGGPVTWPANARQVDGVVNKVKLGSEMGMSGFKMDDVDSLIEAKVDKGKLKLAKLQSRSKDKETKILMSEGFAGKDLSGLSMVQLNEINRLVGENLNRMNFLNMEDDVLNGNGVHDHAGPSEK